MDARQATVSTAQTVSALSCTPTSEALTSSTSDDLEAGPLKR